MKTHQGIINIRVDLHEVDQEGKCLPGENLDTFVLAFFDVDKEVARSQALQFLEKIREEYEKITNPQTNKA